MDFEKQKPVSDEYRENWERLFSGTREFSNRFRIESSTATAYPNGCPILTEGPQKDDL